MIPEDEREPGRPGRLAVVYAVFVLPDPAGGDAEALREVLRLTINGIAAGLRNTG